MKIHTWILLIVGVVILGVCVYVGFTMYGAQTQPLAPTGAICTEEAKICPDGSYVGRTGPTCEFAPCPGE